MVLSLLMIFLNLYCSGEGISDMLLQLVMWTQKTMVEKLTYREELQVDYIVTSLKLVEYFLIVNCIDSIVICLWIPVYYFGCQ